MSRSFRAYHYGGDFTRGVAAGLKRFHAFSVDGELQKRGETDAFWGGPASAGSNGVSALLRQCVPAVMVRGFAPRRGD